MAKRNRRTFTAQFKAKVVLEALTGESSQAEICREYRIGPNLLANWKATFLEHCDSAFRADHGVPEQSDRVAELERLVGQQALELAALKKASRLLAGTTTPGGRSS